VVLVVVVTAFGRAPRAADAGGDVIVLTDHADELGADGAVFEESQAAAEKLEDFVDAPMGPCARDARGHHPAEVISEVGREMRWVSGLERSRRATREVRDVIGDDPLVFGNAHDNLLCAAALADVP
jgi:hypothetical protein